MSDKNPFSAGSSHARSGRAFDQWHDLVAATLALEHSPRVRPSGALLAGIEKRLGFAPRRSKWSGSSVLAGGVAASFALVAGLMAWRAVSTSDRIEVAMTGTVEPSAVTINGGTEMAHPTASADLPNPVATVGANVASGGASTQVAAGVTLNETAAPAAPAATIKAKAAPADRISIAVATGVIREKKQIAGVFSDAGAGGWVSSRIERPDEPIELKSDSYVAGMISAAMQNPSSANPYDVVFQPIEWSDWSSGYEFGIVLPPAEAFALVSTWNPKEPPSGSVGAAADPTGDQPPVSATIAAPPLTSTIRVSGENSLGPLKPDPRANE